jgi:TubC N-terminal docking domain
VTATELLDALRERGVLLEAAGGHLRYRPASAVPAELREALAVYKPEVLRLLAFQAAVQEYELLGAQIDVLTDQAMAARERGDSAEATRLFGEQRRLVQGPYWWAGERVGEFAPADEEESAGQMG